jgi:hypothetical protein
MLCNSKRLRCIGGVEQGELQTTCESKIRVEYYRIQRCKSRVQLIVGRKSRPMSRIMKRDSLDNGASVEDASKETKNNNLGKPTH